MEPRDRTLGARHVTSRLVFGLLEPSVLALHVAVARSGPPLLDESLVVTVGGVPLAVPVAEIVTAREGRMHVVEAPAGELEVDYAATVGPAPVGPAGRDDVPPDARLHDDESIVALRQSRYCPSDELEGFAAVEFGALRRDDELAPAIASWVFERLACSPGASGHLDTAVDTLLANAGVCRDFAHLTIALCRALGRPARLAAVYAPGLSPMDFHAVVEVRRGSGWEVLDPTRLAPRQSLVRIATGRDAADTAFATTLEGEVELLVSEVSATVEGDLPLDDHRIRLSLA